jgi:hypothetical protein
MLEPEADDPEGRKEGSMFEPQNARQEFEKILRGRGLLERDLNLAAGCEALFDFYRDKRPIGRAFEQHEDADMLLFQWGTYDWGTGEHFAFNLTRQLIVREDAEDEDIWQLSLTFEFDADNKLRAVGNGNKWCHSLSELPEFREYVRRSAAFAAGTEHQARRTVLEYGIAG